MSEIEIKFVTAQSALSPFLNKVVPAIEKEGFAVSKAQEKQLQNDYYDTREQTFKQQKMGFRVRGNNGNYEQTLKTHGKVSGGLHQRAEFNVPLKNALPDLRLFDKTVWPPHFDAQKLNNDLERQFSTHFTRFAFDMTYEDTHIEVVVDEGEVTTGKSSAPIREIEIELVKGDANLLFRVAVVINQQLAVRLSDVSKAAQGYQLLEGLQPQIKPLPQLLPLESDINTQDAFCRALDCALSHWQVHEHLYVETGSVKMLYEVTVGIRLLLQSVSLYLPVLQCPEMLSLHKQLMAYAQQWDWHDDLQSLRYLLSRKSLFTKFLSKHPSLISYLQGRKTGLLQAHTPSSLFYDNSATAIKLSVVHMRQNKPWQRHAKGYDMPVMEHARGWLSQGWQTIQQSMPAHQDMHEANYSAIEVLLRQTLWNGFLLADLFTGERGEFRAPWLDILTGIDELKALLMLKQALHEAELDSQESLMTWANDKVNNLIRVMERTRRVAIEGDLYW